MDERFSDLIASELVRARQKHYPMNSVHEAYATILEELDEFWDEVKAQHHDKTAMLKELVQTAAMCQRAAEDLRLI